MLLQGPGSAGVAWGHSLTSLDASSIPARPLPPLLLPVHPCAGFLSHSSRVMYTRFYHSHVKKECCPNVNLALESGN